jgi:hypothetical protein
MSAKVAPVGLKTSHFVAGFCRNDEMAKKLVFNDCINF